MNIYIRADASNKIGTGHVMRCLTLANELRKIGLSVTFITRKHNGHLGDYIKSKGFNLKLLPAAVYKYKDRNTNDFSNWLGVHWEEDALQTQKTIECEKDPIDWLVIDHYGIDHKWEKKQREVVKNILVIDDLANRKHDCDILLDQNYFENGEERYRGLVPNECKLLLGPRYILLREEFSVIAPKVRNKISRLFVFMGGTDTKNVTMKVMDACLLLQNINLEIDIIAGSLNPNKHKIKTVCDQYSNIHYYEQIENIAEIMSNSDLAIGAGGTTIWERCYLGLPSIVITIAGNQEFIAKTLNKLGAIKYLGPQENVLTEDILIALQSLLSEQKGIEKMSLASLKLMRGVKDHNRQLLDEILTRKDHG